MSWQFWTDFLNSDKDYYEFEQPIDLATGKPVRYAKETYVKRGIDNIAYDILEDWSENYTRNIPNEVKPYLKAMTELISIDEMYGYDSADSIVKYFLLNAIGKYHTEKSEKLLNELKELVNWED